MNYSPFKVSVSSLFVKKSLEINKLILRYGYKNVRQVTPLQVLGSFKNTTQRKVFKWGAEFEKKKVAKLLY
jgi:hypothetical protein